MLDNSFLAFEKAGEIKEFSVSEISSRIKEILETNIGVVRVKGEISGLKIAASGHGYFSLKDNLAVLGCTCWRPVLAKMKFPLSDGMEVVIIGKITAYAGQSRYQISVEKIEPAGAGAMMKILQERRAALEKEGLFDPAKKKPIPFMPRSIGVITSISGAVIRDIIHRVTDRCPTRIIIWSVAVQGESSASEVANAIIGFNQCQGEARPDVLIVARGGGSIEDLWSFNEEIVVRAVAGSVIPVISAVGHETDYTLVDFVSDLRAPTPTAAAEFAVPVLADLKYTINSYYNRLQTRLMEKLRYYDQFLAGYDRLRRHPASYVQLLEQKVDELGFRLIEALPNLLKLKTAYLERFTIGGLNPSKLVHYKALQLEHTVGNLDKLIKQRLDNFEYQLNISSALLASLDYHNVLKRGFAIVKGANGKFISAKSEIGQENNFAIEFHDGEVAAKLL